MIFILILKLLHVSFNPLFKHGISMTRDWISKDKWEVSNILTHLQQTTFENIVTKGETAQNGRFVLFASMFSTYFSNNIYNYRDFQYF